MAIKGVGGLRGGWGVRRTSCGGDGGGGGRRMVAGVKRLPGEVEGGGRWSWPCSREEKVVAVLE